MAWSLVVVCVFLTGESRAQPSIGAGLGIGAGGSRQINEAAPAEAALPK